MVKGHFIPIHQAGDHLVSAVVLSKFTMWLFCYVNLELDDFIQKLDSREKRKNLFKKSRKQSTPLEGNAPKDAPTWAIQKQQTSSPGVGLCCVFTSFIFRYEFL